MKGKTRMSSHRKTHRLVPLLALSMTLAMPALANAQNRQRQESSGTSARLEINFGSSPHWVAVPGTHVRGISQRSRTDYDVFQYERYYYAYNQQDQRWYRSRHWRGQFSLVDDRYVPRELRMVPRNRWRNYPSAWEDRRSEGGRYNDGRYGGGRYNGGARYQGSGGTSGTIQVTFGRTPRWTGVPGTQVDEIPMAERPGYDVFRYGGSYYAYDNDRWYTSNRESGDFNVIDDRSVPAELSRVPREHWRHYPSAWQSEGQQSVPSGQRNHGR